MDDVTTVIEVEPEVVVQAQPPTLNQQQVLQALHAELDTYLRPLLPMPLTVLQTLQNASSDEAQAALLISRNRELNAIAKRDRRFFPDQIMRGVVTIMCELPSRAQAQVVCTTLQTQLTPKQQRMLRLRQTMYARQNDLANTADQRRQHFQQNRRRNLHNEDSEHQCEYIFKDVKERCTYQVPRTGLLFCNRHLITAWESMRKKGRYEQLTRSALRRDEYNDMRHAMEQEYYDSTIYPRQNS